MSRRFLVLAIAAVIWGNSNLYAAQESVTFPLPAYNDVPFVPVTIDGKEHLFVVDSGTSMNVFDLRLKDALGKPITSRPVSDAGGSNFNIEFFESPAASVGPIPITREWPTACHDLSLIRSASGREIDGILGIPFFVTNIIQFDFDGRELRILRNTTTPTKEWGDQVMIKIDEGNLPVVRAALAENIEEDCVIDTGNTGSVSMLSPIYDDLLKRNAILNLPESSFMTLSGYAQKRHGTLAMLKLAGFSHKSVTIDETADKSRIGLAYLRRYSVTFNLAEERIFLLPGAQFDRKDRPQRVGMGLVRRENATIVMLVIQDSPAARSGILVGDNLISIDGEQVEGKPLAEIRDTFAKCVDRNGKLEFRLDRQGTPLTVVVATNQDEASAPLPK